jgi:iron-sulfur cluster repair protein YtfE (RIC family)/CBS domain-containing protein
VTTVPSDWENLPIIALAAHLAEHHHDPQPADLQRLRQLLSIAFARGANGTDDALQAIEDLFHGLEAASETHLRTTAILFSHVVALEEGVNTVRLSAPSATRLLQGLRVGHEAARALFDNVRRLTTDSSLPEEASDAVRNLYAEVALLDQRADAHARLENEVLVARILRLDPAIERDAAPVTLPVRTIEQLSAAGHRQVSMVFCPAEKRSFARSWCEKCPLVREVSEATVRCTPNAAAHPRDACATRRRGEDLSVGEAMGRHHVSVGRDVAAGVVARAMDEFRTSAAVVVDCAGRTVGMVERDRVEYAHQEQTASEVERKATGIEESASLADAIARMVKTRERFLPVVGADGRVVGMLADIDALHLIATAGQRR